jgi:hypothetical protein
MLLAKPVRSPSFSDDKKNFHNVHAKRNMAREVLPAVCCLLSAVCCLLSAVCCLLSAVPHCLLFVTLL